MKLDTCAAKNLPSVNVADDLKSTALTMGVVEIVPNPSDKVIFESAFNKLMEEVRRKQFMDVGTGKAVSKGLDYDISVGNCSRISSHTTMSPLIPYLSQITLESKFLTRKSVFSCVCR